MLGHVRDVSAVFTLERALGRLREDLIDLVHAGGEPGPSFWDEGEERIFAFIKESHFARAVRVAADPDDARSELEAWEEREGVSGEEAALWTHRRLREIPFLGDGTHDLPDVERETSGDAA